MPVIVNDISEHQGTVSWAAYRAARQAVILRAHNGNRRDTLFAANRTGARPLRLVGIYQYLVASRDPAAQARDFVATVGELAANEWPVLDIEEGDRFATRARAWLAVVEKALGCRAWVYSGDSNWQTTDLREAAGDRPRWVARYSSTAPRTQPWHLWQRSSTARAPGVSGDVDESIYPGTLDQIVALARGNVGPPGAGAGPGGANGSGQQTPRDTAEDDDMVRLYRATGDSRVFAGAPGVWWHVPTPAQAAALSGPGGAGAVHTITPAQRDALAAAYPAMRALGAADKEWIESIVKEWARFYALRAAQVMVAGHANRGYTSGEVPKGESVREQLAALVPVLVTAIAEAVGTDKAAVAGLVEQAVQSLPAPPAASVED